MSFSEQVGGNSADHHLLDNCCRRWRRGCNNHLHIPHKWSTVDRLPQMDRHLVLNCREEKRLLRQSVYMLMRCFAVLMRTHQPIWVGWSAGSHLLDNCGWRRRGGCNHHLHSTFTLQSQRPQTTFLMTVLVDIPEQLISPPTG